MEIEPIAYVETPFHEKFGVPRQGALTPHVAGRIVFTSAYQNPDYIRGIADFERLWLIWGFSKVSAKHLNPTVRPPRLGGNERRGVFATRSPFRPNRLGLTCVTLVGVGHTPAGQLALDIQGVDLVDGTPIYDIKPYSPEADAFPEVAAGFIQQVPFPTLNVQFAETASTERLTEAEIAGLREVLAHDPRPAVQRQQTRMFGLNYYHYNVRFTVEGEQLTVVAIDEEQLEA